jgi:MurNAc alpha-1-phosphate uridylyltransferase
MSYIPKSAMVLAAGLGTRMRPITDTMPKPLVEIGGRTLLDHAIDRLELVGVERVVVNAHYKADMVAAALAGRTRPRIELSRETELLETGGGVARALPLLGEWFFVVNSDVLWLDSRDYALARLAAAFDPQTTDVVLLLQRTVTARNASPSRGARDRAIRVRRGAVAAPTRVRRDCRTVLLAQLRL